jgi:hypothetical protein
METSRESEADRIAVDGDDGRLGRLEDAIRQQMASSARLEAALANLITNLTPPAPPPEADKPNRPLSSQPLAVARKETKLKPSAPVDYDGDRKNGRHFLNQCELYIRLRSSDFPDEATEINWALSYMKSGRAATFAERLINYEVTAGRPRYDNWYAFREDFVETFCPLDEASIAVTRLESEAYFQGRRTLDEYIDEFEELLRKSGYEDGKVAVVKFRRGLDPRIQNPIACSQPESRPADDNVKSWITAARTLDQNRQANEAFRGAAQKPTAATQKPNAGKSFFNFAPAAGAPAPPAPPTRSLPPPVPMDIDAQRSKRTPGTCFRCGSPDHFSNKCPRAYDVRYMTVEERQEWIQHMLVVEDVAAAPEPEEEAREEDFASRSG